MRSLICLQDHLGELPKGGKRSRLCRGDRFDFLNRITFVNFWGKFMALQGKLIGKPTGKAMYFSMKPQR
ncbi:hypothetical protein FD724_07025 [Nostoc sp. C057]|uniref:hypothetical protein n=1 Tax=Nostoc sp. C057 TaxID=2576903 RepID=UPI0015C3921D|nr:hypothetical protein [Nostoc sp. C057]QLE47890.1 hypothetical protein FD724_07025 [Nostoc sp. C057]